MTDISPVPMPATVLVLRVPDRKDLVIGHYRTAAVARARLVLAVDRAGAVFVVKNNYGPEALKIVDLRELEAA